MHMDEIIKFSEDTCSIMIIIPHARVLWITKQHLLLGCIDLKVFVGKLIMVHGYVIIMNPAMTLACIVNTFHLILV